MVKSQAKRIILLYFNFTKSRLKSGQQVGVVNLVTFVIKLETSGEFEHKRVFNAIVTSRSNFFVT